jgi:hypothetical protein
MSRLNESQLDVVRKLQEELGDIQTPKQLQKAPPRVLSHANFLKAPSKSISLKPQEDKLLQL